MEEDDYLNYDVSENFHPSFLRLRISKIVGVSEAVRNIHAPEYKKRTGEDFILFQRGELDCKPYDLIKQKITEGQEKGYVRYPQSGGESVLKDAIIEDLELKGINGISRENILITYGGQEGLQLSHCLFRDANETIIDPIWSCMIDNMIPYSGVNVFSVPLEERNGIITFRESKLESTVKETNSKLIYLNNPQNPSGKVYTQEEMEMADRIARKNKAVIIWDEAYDSFVFDGQEHLNSLKLNNPHSISVFTFSKTYAATGYRIGFTVSRNKKIIEQLTKGEYTQTAGVQPFIQYAFSEVLRNKDFLKSWIPKITSEMEARRDIAHGILSQTFEDLYMPGGAFYFFLDLNSRLPKNLKDEEKDQFVQEKFLSNGVAVVPGSAFGEGYQGWIRLSYSGMNRSKVEEGCHKVNKIIQRLAA
ncbi:MAG: pyridoxal phosphate-dependent aminotransferase [Nanoarchaeota archaeon]